MNADGELPEGWARAKVGEIANSIQPGFACGGHNQEGRGTVHLRPMNVTSEGRLSLDDVRRVETKVSHVVEAGDVLFNNTNSADLVGKTAFVPESCGYGFSNHMTRIRCGPVMDPAFLAMQLNTMFRSGYFKTRCNNHVSQASISSGFLRDSVEVVVPPLAEQRRIVARLESLQARSRAARAALAEVPALLEQLRQSVLAAAFRGDLTADWRERNPDVEPASALLARIRAERRKRWEAKSPRKKYAEPEPVDASELPELPEGWEWCYLKDLGYMNRGKSRHRPRNAPELYGGKYPFIQTGDISRSDGSITGHSQTYSEAGLSQSRLWPAGTVCITIAANIACSAILTYPACFPYSVVGVIPDDGLCQPEYVEFFLRTARADLERFAPATAQRNINIEILSEVAVPIAPQCEQSELLRLVRLAFDRSNNVERHAIQSRDELTNLDQSLLARAFRGELVPQDPADEPADALLARVRQSPAAAGRRGRRKPIDAEDAL